MDKYASKIGTATKTSVSLTGSRMHYINQAVKLKEYEDGDVDVVH